MAKRTNAESHSSVVSLADEDKVKEVLVGTVLGLWDVVNNLTRLRPSKKETIPGIHFRLGAGSEGVLGLQ